MKNFTLLLTGLFLTFTAFAQTPMVEKVWDHSKQSNATWDPVEEEWIPGDAPAWMGGTTERGMTHMDGKIYIASRNGGNKIVVLDAATGLEIPSETITLAPEDVSGGTLPINSIAVTESGKIIITSLAGNTQSVDAESGEPNGHFRAYMVDPDNGNAVTPLFMWHNVGDAVYPGMRLGDGMNFYGDIADGKNGYLITAAASDKFVLRWDFVNGVVVAEPTIIELLESVPAPAEGAPVSLGIAPQLFPINETTFMVDGHGTQPMVFDMDGNMLASFTGEVTTQQEGVSGGSWFQFKDRDFVFAPTTNWAGTPLNAFELFELPGGSFEAAVSLGIIPALGMGSEKNTSFSYPVAVDVQPEQVLLFMMVANNGIACYKLTMDPGTSVGGELAADKFVVNNPATGVVRFNTEMAKVNLYDLSGRLIHSINNANEINVDGLKGLYVISGVKANGQTVKQKVMVK
ncbi:Por secretion system C-terminal sorting domain-containing protein [Saccharicrinis carchari]|uniref:Por secretion system C-terminal sorting domain-containing protein n=1 Tax=Saccharicrinis carchari TaxID=1168039 RepID=A0A521B3J9_SACCC|nr:T9SS type A sorting domain-containing protein [Saccharicrinis carchari]SMO41694.1 Por secretion system C-terminal sorting domain-containing protein [Saccharicrinis carchari]